MPRLTRIYTKSGDDGTTSLGSGRRVPKDHERIEAYGTVDETNSVLGVALAAGLHDDVAQAVRPIQNDLFHLGSALCYPEDEREGVQLPVIEDRHVDALEGLLDRFSEELPPLENFILPGGSVGAAHLHVARCVCRRAERAVVALSRQETVAPASIRYLNRLSDLFFVLARVENARRGAADVCWDSRR